MQIERIRARPELKAPGEDKLNVLRLLLLPNLHPVHQCLLIANHNNKLTCPWS